MLQLVSRKSSRSIQLQLRYSVLLRNTLKRSRSSFAVRGNDVSSIKSSTDDIKPFDDIPGPKRHWAVAMLELLMHKGGLFKAIYSAHEKIVRDYGPLIKVTSVLGTEVFVADPNDAATIFREESRYPVRVNIPTLTRIREKYEKKAGVFFNDGQEWYKHRKVLSQRMLRPPEIIRYIPRLNCIVDDMMVRIDKARIASKNDKYLEVEGLDQELFYWSFESVTDFLFDRRFGALSETTSPEAKDFIRSMALFLKNIVVAVLTPPIVYKFYKPKALADFESAFLKLSYYGELFVNRKMEELVEREKTGALNLEKDDIQEFIPFLLSNNKIKPEEVSSSMVETMFAGVDTTSNTMQWALYLLAKNPEKQQLLRNEIDRILPNNKRANASSLTQMPYLKATIKETLRMYPVLISINRVLQDDIVLSGYHVPAGTQIQILLHAMSRRKDLFDSPLHFQPERWLRGNKNSTYHAYASLPFGHGVRMCIGRRLAELEMKLLLIRMLQKYVLYYPEGETVGQTLRGTNIPDQPLRVKFIERT